MAADTSQRILDVAERLVQTRGFNGFSYADIAEALHVTKASLHYHFPGKAELGARLIQRYERNFQGALARIDAEAKDARDKLRRYVAIYESVLRDGRMCLCGMLAAEYGTLPEAMRDDVRHFFDANEKWLVGVLQQGRRDKSLAFRGTAAQAAQGLVGALEGGLMIARSYGDVGRFRNVADQLVKELST
jgi:TetR/AcrR family transcriptional repressor of nem operon